MRKLTFVLLLIGLFGLTSCSKSAKDKIVGSWQLESVEGVDDITDEMKESITMTFNKDNTFKFEAGDQVFEGKYTVSKDGKTISFDSGDAETDKELTMNELTIEGDKVTFKDNDQKSTTIVKKK